MSNNALLISGLLFAMIAHSENTMTWVISIIVANVDVL
jgi:hypothetical protein